MSESKFVEAYRSLKDARGDGGWFVGGGKAGLNTEPQMIMRLDIWRVVLSETQAMESIYLCAKHVVTINRSIVFYRINTLCM